MSSPFAQPGARLPRTPFRRIHPASLGLVVSASALGALAAFASSAEQNWAQWRGPFGTGVAPSADPPVTWSETNNIRWKVRIPGEGSATPIVWDNEDDSFLLALDKNTGKTLWKTPRDERTSWATPLVVVHEGKPQVITDASPAIAGRDLFFRGKEHLYCIADR